MRYFLGIDLGTSYFKTGLFDENGKQLGLGRRSVEKHVGKGNTCELSVECFWETLRLCIREAMQQANLSSRDIEALSYSSQANSFLLLDDSDKPLTPLILWTDERAGEELTSLQILTGKNDFIAKTGLGILPGKQAMIAKIEWFQRNQPHVWKRVRSVMSISDYLLFALTGHRIGDLSTSSMTGLLNVPQSKWWCEAIDLFHIQERQLSTPVGIGSRIGTLTSAGAALIGISQRTILFSGGLDHHMVAVAAGLLRRNCISESTGTVLACVNYRKGYEPRKGINVARGIDDSHFFQMAFDGNGAVALEWYRNSYASDCPMARFLEEAGKVKIGSDGLFARPKADEFDGLNGFENIRREHTHAHFARAIMESTAVSLLRLINRLDSDNESEAVIASGGGAKSHLWLQIKANLLNKTFFMPSSGELACKGAAMLCAIGSSCFKDIDEAMKKQVAFGSEILPNPADVEIYKKWYNTIKMN